MRPSEDEGLVAGLALLAGVLDLLLPRAVRGAQRDPDHEPREGGADDRGRGGAEEALEGRGNLEKTGLGQLMPDFEDHLYNVTCCFRSLMAGTWYLHPASQEEISPSDLKELTQPTD